VRGRLARAHRALADFSERPSAPYALVVVALAVYALVSVAFPLAAGRDLGTYLRASFELRQEEIALPQALLMRAPLTGVVAEGLLELGPLVSEVVLALLYALSVLCWWRVARRLGPTPGLLLAGLLLAYPGYVLLFHRLASDALYAAAFALAALLTARLVEQRTAGRAAAVGGVLALLVLVRPVSQILILLAPLLLLGKDAWRPRLGALAALVATAVVPLVVWAGHNAVRGDDFTVVRGAGHGLPLYRAFVEDRIVDPANGEATRELARAVEDDLLPRDPYRAYGIDLDTFFSAGSARMHEDLIGLSDRTWGWDDDYAHLARVGREAVLAEPGAYARGVARDASRLLWWPVFLPVAGDAGEAAPTRRLAQSPPLPEPTEGQPIPSASVSAFISTPDGTFREVWTSQLAHEIVSDDPAAAAHLDRMNRRVDDLLGRFSERDRWSWLGEWLNRASRWFPRPAVWLVLGGLAVAIRRPRALATPLVLAGAALLVVVGTSLAVPAAAEYSTPVAPAFLLLAAAGLLAPRRGAT
jgi:hypothetical protein